MPDEEDDREYARTIDACADRIANAIDEGASPKDADDVVFKYTGMSGLQAMFAWGAGMKRAKDQTAAEQYRSWWNNRFAPGVEVPEGHIADPTVSYVEVPGEGKPA